MFLKGRDELALGALLGAGFEAYFPNPEDRPEDVKKLIKALEETFTEAAVELLPAAPEEGNPGRATWDGLRSNVEAGLRRTLQLAVRGMML